MIQQKKDGRHIILPKFITNMKLSNIYTHIIEFNLGYQIEDHSFFKGCSGAPIFDKNNNLFAILTGGSSNVKEPFLYGFRFDIVKKFIDLLYFNESLDWALKNKQTN